MAHPVGLEGVAEAVEPVSEVTEGAYLVDAEASQVGLRRFQECLPRWPRTGPVVEKADEADPVLQHFLDRMEAYAVVLLALATDGHVGETHDGASVVFHHQKRLVRQVIVRLPVPFFIPPDSRFELFLRDGIAVRHGRELLVVEVCQSGRLADF